MKNQEIKYLEDFEHIRLRATIYVGSVEPSDEKLPIIKDSKIFIETKTISVGMLKIFNETLDNAVDIFKKNSKLKNKTITVKINSKTNQVDVIDNATGFYKGIEKNPKTGKTNIETAVSFLRAGSNFSNGDTEEAVIGTNGVGVSATNMLSEFFEIETKNESSYFLQTWKEFVTSNQVIKKAKQKETGTRVSFIPTRQIFKTSKWDFEVIKSLMIMKKFILDDGGSGIGLKFYWDDELIDLNEKFYPANSYVCSTNLGTLIIWEHFEGSGSISFVNSALCQGIHQKVINDQINNKLDDSLAHHFYETLFILNLPPRLVKFGDQNKTRFITIRDEVEPPILESFKGQLQKFYSTELFGKIKEAVEERKKDGELKKLRNLKKKQKVKFDTNYFPASGRGENLFIVEGLSAMGSILQKRNTHTDAVYALKGKIKNARSISDLTNTKEIIDLMQILDLDPDPTKRSESTFKRIIIATDADQDGSHIFSLIVNLFFKWFPYVINEGRLYKLTTPLISVDTGKQRDYFYSMKEFEEFSKRKKSLTNLRYLKGLGSLSIQDWEKVMQNKKLIQIKKGTDAAKWIDMAFGNSSELRKKWLSGKF